MFNKTADYLYGELTATLDDYKLLENMNKASVLKYSDMKQVAGNISKNMVQLDEQCRFFCVKKSNCVLLVLILQIVR